MINDWNATTQHSIDGSGYPGQLLEFLLLLNRQPIKNATALTNNGKPLITHLNFAKPLNYDFNKYGDIYHIAYVLA